jgi:hypothetical protein
MEMVIVLALLYQQIGVAAFAGFAAVMCLMPMQFYFSRLFSTYRMRTVSRTDLRVKTVLEILIAADVMKMMVSACACAASLRGEFEIAHLECSWGSEGAMLMPASEGRMSRACDV